MEDNRRGYILKQMQEQEKVMTKFKDNPDSPEYKAALKAYTTLAAELRKEEELDLKKKEREFEMEIKKEAEKHRMEIENLDCDIRFKEANSRIEMAEKEFDFKVHESESKVKQQGLLTAIDLVKKSLLLGLAYKLESTGFVFNWNNLTADRKLG